jgi:MFS family permease
MNNPAATSRLIHQREFVLFWLARVGSTVGYQMLVLTIGWQIYELTNSPLDLGIVGLIQFVPAIAFILVIGHAADRYDRRLIVRTAQSICALSALLVTGALFLGNVNRELLFAAVFLLGCARAFEQPTSQSLVPSLVPTRLLPRAVAAWTSANQVAVICGPALGGLVYVLSPVVVGCLCVLFFAGAVILISMIHPKGATSKREPPTLASMLGGFDYIRHRRRLLGVVSLDFCVVLLGGAIALLPIFAKDILTVGPVGLGLLRSAPAVGALVTSIVLSHAPIERWIGIKMFAVVAIYGASTVVFGLSTWFPLSLAALVVLGASDAVSVVIRFSLVQIETPDSMRGRVSAINYLFVGSSNTLGDFRAGVVADWFGAVTSVMFGGVGSLLVAVVWMLLFPDLRRLDRFEPADEITTSA